MREYYTNCLPKNCEDCDLCYDDFECKIGDFHWKKLIPMKDQKIAELEKQFADYVKDETVSNYKLICENAKLKEKVQELENFVIIESINSIKDYEKQITELQTQLHELPKKIVDYFIDESYRFIENHDCKVCFDETCEDVLKKYEVGDV